MQKLSILIGAATVASTAALAADDPVAVRKALMQNNAAAAGVANGIMKDEIAYSPALGKAAIMAWNATAHAIGDFFPEGSAGPDNGSRASPKIWEDMSGFQATLGNFAADVAAAVEASGADGPPDKAAFVAVAQPVLENCGTCHGTWRLP